MLAVSLSDKFCYFGIFVFVFNRFLFFRFSFVLVFIMFFVLVSVFVNEFAIFSFSPFWFPFSLSKITLVVTVASHYSNSLWSASSSSSSRLPSSIPVPEAPFGSAVIISIFSDVVLHVCAACIKRKLHY